MLLRWSSFWPTAPTRSPLTCVAGRPSITLRRTAIWQRWSGGVDLMSKDENVETAFQITAENGHVAAMELLLAHGADPLAAVEYGKTAFHYAARNGHVVAMEFLLARGADPLAADENGATAFQYAAVGGHRTAMELLLAKGADLLAKDMRGNTALRFACEVRRTFHGGRAGASCGWRGPHRQERGRPDGL